MKSNRKSMYLVSNVLAMIVAAILLSTGLIHAAQPYYFIHSIASYRLLPVTALGLFGLWLPYIQIVVAFCIGLRIVDRTALALAAVLFMAFTIAQITVILRGLNIDCGCFGFVAYTVTPTSALLPLVLCLCSVVALIGSRSHQHTAQEDRRAHLPV